MSAPSQRVIRRRVAGDNVWLGHPESQALDSLTSRGLSYEVLESEEAVGHAMLEEIEAAARNKQGDLVIVLLGGRGAQALHRLLGEAARSGAKDDLLKRLHCFTQDALAPMRTDNGLSFVRDF